MTRTRQGATSEGPPAVICRALREHRRLAFDYGGRAREVEPYCHGTSTAGKEILRAVQVGGESGSGGFGFGTLWELAKMSNVRLGDPFSPDDPDYHPDDSAMARIHCRIDRGSR